jgi:site-specific DNA recombinase
VLAALKARQGMAFKRGAGRRYLLTGFAFCGSCGNKLGVGKARSNSSSAYRCDTRGSHTFTVKGCGRISRNVAPLEALIEEYVLYRLDSDALLEAVNRAQDDRGEVKELIELQRTQQQKINDLVDEYATTTLWSKAEFARAKSAANTNLASINKKLSAISYRHTLTNIDLSKSLHETWQTATLEWKRGIIELLIDKVLVYPYPVRGYKLKYFRQWRFNVELIEVVWKS